MLFSSKFHLKIVRRIIITPHFITQLLNNHTYNKIPQLAPTPISSSRVFCLDMKVKMVLPGKSITTKITPEVLYIEMFHPPVHSVPASPIFCKKSVFFLDKPIFTLKLPYPT